MSGARRARPSLEHGLLVKARTPESTWLRGGLGMLYDGVVIPSNEQPDATKGAASPDEAPQNFGFGVVMASQPGVRLINTDGTFNVARTRKTLLDHFSYPTLLNVGWPMFFGWVMAVFLVLNAIFAALYLLCGPGALVEAGPSLKVGLLWRALFFSVHTFSTIGYGNVVPVGHAANLIVSLEALTALLNAALITGLVFARFSKPNIRIEFSTRGVVRLRNKPALLVRLRNLTRNEVLEVEATVLAWLLDPADGKSRRFHTLAIERSKITFLPLSWTIAHFIAPGSPFHGLTEQQLREQFGEVIVQIRGIDQTSSQPIYARASYTVDQIAWNARYADQYVTDPESGALGIDPKRFHDVEWD